MVLTIKVKEVCGKVNLGFQTFNNRIENVFSHLLCPIILFQTSLFRKTELNIMPSPIFLKMQE